MLERFRPSMAWAVLLIGFACMLPGLGQRLAVEQAEDTYEITITYRDVAALRYGGVDVEGAFDELTAAGLTSAIIDMVTIRDLEVQGRLTLLGRPDLLTLLLLAGQEPSDLPTTGADTFVIIGEDEEATIERIQADSRVLRAEQIAPLVAVARPETEDGALLAARILDWDTFDCPTDSAGCAAYHALEYRLLRAVFDDDLGELAREYVGGGASWQALLSLVDQPDSPWWDDVTTRVRQESRDVIVSAALDAAGRELRAALGEPERWTWGALHQARFAEATLGSSGIGPLEWYFDQGPFPAPGAPGAVNNVYVRPSRAYPDPHDPGYVPVDIRGVFGVTNLPSYRFAIDMKDLDGARIVQTTGQSGNPFDRHYGDLIDDWLAGRTVPLPFTLAAVSEAAVESLQLVPRATPR